MLGPAAGAAAAAAPRWVERLETALSIYGVADVEMRRNLLLHHMGPESYDVICDKLAPASPRTKTFQEIVQLLEAYYNPQRLEISENYRFNCRRQGDKDAVSAEETVDEYLVALRRIAITCNFDQYLEKALRNQLVFGIKRNDIRSRLLEKRNLTLQDARDIAVGMELSRKGGAEIEGQFVRSDVHVVHRQPEKKKVHKDSANDSEKKLLSMWSKVAPGDRV
ncbi:uncharacterized protein LOC135704655 [Ochlerotatus camptorhynchus]|uniref:uncharacterized protein LOC135704655 n=1 Tax=Ochlerotatus camptorhynchus TaxID=644619 RepID=UPI0031D67F49